MKNIENLNKLKELAMIYSDLMHSAKTIMINSDNDCFEQDKLYFWASQTLDDIFKILLSKEFGDNVQYGNDVKEILGSILVDAIHNLK